MRPDVHPAEFAFTLLAGEFAELVAVLKSMDLNTAAAALDDAERRIAKHLYETASRIGGEPDWLVSTAASLRKAVDAARMSLERTLQ